MRWVRPAMRWMLGAALVSSTVAFSAETVQTTEQFTPSISAAAEAGVTNFVGTLGSHTVAGLSWGVRAAYNFTPMLSAELQYQGGHNGISDSRFPVSQAITTTSLSADAKLGVPLAVLGTTVEPFAFGGLGGAYFGVNSAANTPYAGSGALQIPLGAGADVKINKVLSAGARFNYDLNFGNRVSTEGGGDQWAVVGTVGATY
jgi:hypothetical protein